MKLLVVALLLPSALACTAIIAGRLATLDGAVYTASAADCDACDFRLAKVFADANPPVNRPVYEYNYYYPHVVSNRSVTWSRENLEAYSERQKKAWKETTPIGTIPHNGPTYALIEGGAGYALMNEMGVAIGESTCAGVFVAKPRNAGGDALMDVSELTRIALERCATAKEAIAMMGELAETYGYYGPNYDEEGSKYEEAGESLMVGDKREAWVFHVLPDDTGRSAVWAAKRVADSDITVVANFFTIREIGDGDGFMHSKTIFDVAKRNGLWNGKGKLDFSKAFGKVAEPSRSTYSTRRVWRVFTVANPDLVDVLKTTPNDWMDGYPFSVTPKRKLSRDDLFAMYRDHFDGTQFDLSRAQAGGPYGDPDRYDIGAVGNMSKDRAREGEFGRATSMFRTSYVSIVRAKSGVPKEVGSMMYFAPQQASSSVFVPIWIGRELPKVFRRGNLLRYSDESLFWAVTVVGNWVHKYYNHAIGYLRGVQETFEEYDVEQVEKKAIKLIEKGKVEEAVGKLNEFTETLANKAHATYLQLFPKLVAKFHDGYVMQDEDAEKVNMKTMFYPEWWLKQVGYFEARETGGSYGVVYPKEGDDSDNLTSSTPMQWGHAFLVGLLVGGCSMGVGMFSLWRWGRKDVLGYQAIQ